MFNVGMPNQSKMVTAGNTTGWNGMADPRKLTPGVTPPPMGMGGFSGSHLQGTPAPPTQPKPSTPPTNQPPTIGKPAGDLGVTNGTLLGTTGPVNRPTAFSGQSVQAGPPSGNPVQNNNGNYQQQNTPNPPSGGPEPDWGNPAIIDQFFRDRGVTPRSTSPQYWADRWREWGSKDPEFFKKFLSNAEEFTGGSQQTANAMGWGGQNSGQNQQMDMGWLGNLFKMLMGGGQNINQPMTLSNYFGQGMNQNQNQNQNTMDISSLLGNAMGPISKFGGIF